MSDYMLNILLGLLVGVFLGALVSVWVHMDWQRDSVKQGHAEYYLDENNNKQWRWK